MSIPVICAVVWRVSASAHAGGAGGDVEDGLRIGTIDVRDHLASPTPVLSERQQFFEQVVATRERPEQVLGEAVRIDGRCLQGPPRA